MSYVKSLCALLLLLSALLLSVQPACATEGGGGAYPNGAEDFMSGAVPPPGTYFINYFTHYSADRLANNNGNSALPLFKLNVTADVLRLIHVTDKQFLGGFWAMHLFVPLVHVDVAVPGAGKSRNGLGDIIVDPFILAWHGKNWHAATGVDVFIPSGSYDKNDMVNHGVGRNYWTFEPIVAGTYVSDDGYEVSAKFMYDINTRNKDTHYLSGQEFHVDFALGKKTDNFTVGAAGYYYQQVTDDELYNTTVSGNRGRVVALGPAIKYDHKNMSFSLKYQFEMAAYNRPQGNNLWLKFVYAF